VRLPLAQSLSFTLSKFCILIIGMAICQTLFRTNKLGEKKNRERYFKELQHKSGSRKTAEDVLRETCRKK
jgi:hypothetical protein